MSESKERTKVYFAHPMSHYNSSLEKDCLRVIQEMLPNVEIVNPNRPEYQDGYLKEGSFNYFLRIVQSCDAIAFVPYEDGEVGAGVFNELMTMLNKGGKIYQVTDGWICPMMKQQVYDIRPLSITQTRQRNKENIQ
jgi:hypothetical protein